MRDTTIELQVNYENFGSSVKHLAVCRCQLFWRPREILETLFLDDRQKRPVGSGRYMKGYRSIEKGPENYHSSGI